MKRNIKIAANLASHRENAGVLASSLQTRSNMENSDQMSEQKNETTKAKGKMGILTMLVSKKFKEGESDIEGVSDSCRVTNDVMNDWIESRMAQNIANEKNEVMIRNQNWVFGERIIGLRKKRIEFSLE